MYERDRLTLFIECHKYVVYNNCVAFTDNKSVMIRNLCRHRGKSAPWLLYELADPFSFFGREKTWDAPENIFKNRVFKNSSLSSFLFHSKIQHSIRQFLIIPVLDFLQNHLVFIFGQLRQVHLWMK